MHLSTTLNYQVIASASARLQTDFEEIVVTAPAWAVSGFVGVRAGRKQRKKEPFCAYEWPSRKPLIHFALEPRKRVVQNYGMKIGYARVSTDEQNLDLQRQALEAEGCEIVHEDKASGAGVGRKGLSAALAQCATGDVLVVWKLDRLGRSLLDLVSLVENLKARGIGLKVLTGQGAQVDTTRPEGRMIFGIMATLAEFERELIRERTRAGMAAAKRRGAHVGRPRKLTTYQLDQAARMIDAGQSRTDVAALLGVDVATLRRALNGKARA